MSASSEQSGRQAVVVSTGGERDVGWTFGVAMVRGSGTGGVEPVGDGTSNTGSAGSPVAWSDLASSQIGHSRWSESSLPSQPGSRSGTDAVPAQVHAGAPPPVAGATYRPCPWPLVTRLASGRAISRTTARLVRIGRAMGPL